MESLLLYASALKSEKPPCKRTNEKAQFYK